MIGWVESALDALLSQGGRDRAPTTVASRAMLVDKAVRALKDHFVRGGSIAQGSTAQYGSVAEFEAEMEFSEMLRVERGKKLSRLLGKLIHKHGRVREL